MSQDLSAPALIECVRRYYPLELDPEDPRYEQSAEYQRLEHRRREAVNDSGPWQRFVQRAEEAFAHCDVVDVTPRPYRASFHCKVFWPQTPAPLERWREDFLTCMISFLAPVYAIHARHSRDDGTGRESWTRYPPLPPEFQPDEAKLAALIESTLGATRLSNEVLFTRVPGIRPLSLRPENQAPWLVELLF